jgi:hypothetical protein
MSQGGIMGGTTSTSGWALFVFLIGFTVLGTAAIGGGVLSLIAGIALIVGSGFIFQAARKKEEI